MSKVLVQYWQLAQRDFFTSQVEVALEVFEKANVQTLIFNPKKVLGPLQMRNIHSTFLSKLPLRTLDGFFSKSLIQGAMKGFSQQSYDVVISVLGPQGEFLPRSALTNTPRHCVAFIMAPLQHLALTASLLKYIKECSEVWVSSVDWKNALKESAGVEAKVVYPVYNTREFRPYNQSEASIDVCYSEYNLKRKIKSELKKRMKEIGFSFACIDDLCDGELAPLLARCKILIQLEGQQNFFYHRDLAALCGKETFSVNFQEFNLSWWEKIQEKIPPLHIKRMEILKRSPNFREALNQWKNITASRYDSSGPLESISERL